MIVIILAFISSLLNYNENISLIVMNKIVWLTGVGDSNDSNIYLGFPFAINISFTGLLFIYLGEITRKIFDRNNILKNKLLSVELLVICIIIGVSGYKINNGDSDLLAMSQANYGIYPIFILTAITLSIVVIIISKWIDNYLFAKYGKYTLSIYAFHMTIMFIPELIEKYFIIYNSINPELRSIINGIIITIISCIIIPIIRKIDSNLIGEAK